MKELGSNIIKLEGYGVYITYIDSKVYFSPINSRNGHPTLDPDKCVEWTELTEPANQQFLNIINARFDLGLTMHDFGCRLTLPEIKDYRKAQEQQKLMTDSEARWMIKNLREMNT